MSRGLAVFVLIAGTASSLYFRKTEDPPPDSRPPRLEMANRVGPSLGARPAVEVRGPRQGDWIDSSAALANTPRPSHARALVPIRPVTETSEPIVRFARYEERNWNGEDASASEMISALKDEIRSAVREEIRSTELERERRLRHEQGNRPVQRISFYNDPTAPLISNGGAPASTNQGAQPEDYWQPMTINTQQSCAGQESTSQGMQPKDYWQPMPIDPQQVVVLPRGYRLEYTPLGRPVILADGQPIGNTIVRYLSPWPSR